MFDESKEKSDKDSCSNDELLMKPFALGWTREVVKRVIARNSNLNCDIYYFSPNGKKIRSLTEIKSNLTDGLTPECFSFKRQPLGINKNFETVRNARVKRKKNIDSKNSKSQTCKWSKSSNLNLCDGNSIEIKKKKLANLNCELNNEKHSKVKKKALNDSVKYKINTKATSKRALNKPKKNINSKIKIEPHEKINLKCTPGSSCKKIIKKKVNVSKKSKLSGSKNDKETRIKTKNSVTSKNLKNIQSKNFSKENVNNLDSEMESNKIDKKSSVKDLQSIVKKNIGKYREMRERQKLEIKSQIKMKKNKIALRNVTRVRSEPISKNKHLYLKPFEKGWRRELVFRKNCMKAGQHADVYYFHPNGKKLRSCREIAENLTQGLKIDYFTFRKEPIGCGEPSEVIRQARSHNK